jgi:hypothetical protein
MDEESWLAGAPPSPLHVILFSSFWISYFSPFISGCEYVQWPISPKKQSNKLHYLRFHVQERLCPNMYAQKMNKTHVFLPPLTTAWCTDIA